MFLLIINHLHPKCPGFCKKIGHRAFHLTETAQHIITLTKAATEEERRAHEHPKKIINAFVTNRAKRAHACPPWREHQQKNNYDVRNTIEPHTTYYHVNKCGKNGGTGKSGNFG